MRQRTHAKWLGPLAALFLCVAGGCDNGIDPDSLVRELRILGMRVAAGDPAVLPTEAELQAQIVPGAGGIDLRFTRDRVTLSAVVAAPVGPGRRVAAARPLQHDFYLCIGVRSLYSPGTLDPECRKWGPDDPDPKTSSSLFYLNTGAIGAAGGAELTIPTDLLKGILGVFLQTALAGGQSGSTGTGGGTSMLPSRPLVILLPVLLRASVIGGDPKDNRNSEVGYSYLRVVIAVPALGIMLPPPNHNPVLDTTLGTQQRDGMLQPLVPCAQLSDTPGTCAGYPVARTMGTFLTGRVGDGSVESYDPIDDSGRTGVAESLRFSWFSTDGEFSELRTGTMRPQTQWRNGDKYTAAAETATVQVWLVVQDERGGIDWQQDELKLQDAPGG